MIKNPWVIFWRENCKMAITWRPEEVSQLQMFGIQEEFRGFWIQRWQPLLPVNLYLYFRS